MVLIGWECRVEIDILYIFVFLLIFQLFFYAGLRNVFEYIQYLFDVTHERYEKVIGFFAIMALGFFAFSFVSNSIEYDLNTIKLFSITDFYSTNYEASMLALFACFLGGFNSYRNTTKAKNPIVLFSLLLCSAVISLVSEINNNIKIYTSKSEFEATSPDFIERGVIFKSKGKIVFIKWDELEKIEMGSKRLVLNISNFKTYIK